MDELSLDSILSEDQIKDLFDDNTQDTKDPEEETETTEVNPNELFEEEPESVGSEDNKDTEGTDSTKDNTSPDFYSSIANALVEDGIFQNLDEEALSKIKSAEDFAEVFKEQQRLQMDERQKRIDEALTVGVEPTDIQRYEHYINTLENINDQMLSQENEQGENLRKNIIYQDYINRGFTKERATREVERSLKAGTDIEDAKEALQSNKDFYKEEYANLIKEAREEEKQRQDTFKKEAETLRSSILDDKKAFGELELDKSTRQRVYDSIMKPVYTNPETGEKLTAIQRYESENRVEFLKNLGLVYVLTDGFKSLDGLVKGKVDKEVKKGLRRLERTINSSSRNNDGSLKFASGVSDPESSFSGWQLDI